MTPYVNSEAPLSSRPMFQNGRAGSTEGLSFSRKYAAPEVVHALEAGSRSMTVDSAVDVWALGVIAFELLTGERAFPAFNMSAAECERAAQEGIAGRAQLPWEGDTPEVALRLKKLRGLSRSVLQCLHRSPAERPTAAALLSAWDHMFDSMHSRGSEASAASHLQALPMQHVPRKHR